LVGGLPSVLTISAFTQIDERQSAVQPDGSIQVVLNLSDNADTRAYGFNYEFDLEYTVKLTGRSLQTAITVTNPRLVEIVEGFQCLLHTYLALPECTTLAEVAGHGLQGAKYIDKNDNMLEKTETRASKRDRDTGDFISGGVAIAEPIDRIYKAGTGHLQTVAGAEVHYFRGDVPQQKCAVTVVEATCSRAANTTWSGVTPSPDIVVWAPFLVRAKNTISPLISSPPVAYWIGCTLCLSLFSPQRRHQI
jgi:hypothetical protein